MVRSHPTTEVVGFPTHTIVKHIKSLYKVKGVHSYGKYVILINKVGKRFDINVKKVELVKYGKGIQF